MNYIRDLNHNLFIKFSLLLASVQTGLTAFFIFWDKSKSGGIILGLSLYKLVIIAILLLFSFLLLFIGLNWGSKSKFVLGIKNFYNNNFHLILFVIFWLFVFLFFLSNESYFINIFSQFKFIDVANLYSELKPIIILGVLICLEFCFAFYLSNPDRFKLEETEDLIYFIWALRNLEKLFTIHKQNFPIMFWKKAFQKNRTGLIIWGGSLVFWSGIAITRIGITPDDRYWNIAGVPILPQQIVLVTLIIIFHSDLHQLIKQLNNKSKVLRFIQNPTYSLFIILFLWCFTIFYWNSQELKHTYFAPGPYPPNYERYPFSDAASFDVGSQYFLLGRGLNNNVITDRPFLMLFISMLHLIGGQTYEKVIFIQVFILALIPVFLFLIGWKMHSKTAGFAIAFLGVLKEKNSILLATRISLANPKVLTSEVLNSLLLIVISLLLMQWIDSKQKPGIWPLLVGGILGIAIGVRVNSLFLLPIILLLTFLSFKKQHIVLKKWVNTTMWFLFALVLVLAPYSIENVLSDSKPFWLTKITQAYDRSYENEPDLDAVPRSNEKKIIPPTEYSDFLTSSMLMVSKKNIGHNSISVDLPENLITLTIRHFIHNEIMTLLIIPLDYQIQDNNEIANKPFWDNLNPWLGQLGTTEKIILFINLLILSLGIGTAVSNWNVAGATPLFIHFGYNLANAGARTSGGRYIVPVDWVIYVYFIIGLLSIIYNIRNWNIKHTDQNFEIKFSNVSIPMIIIVSIGFLAIGSSYLISGFFDSDYEMFTGKDNLEYLKTGVIGSSIEAVISFDDLEHFVNSEHSFIASGFLLYPRYFLPGENMERSSRITAMPDEYSRLYFMLLTDLGPKHVNVILEDQWVNQFPNAEFAIVMGCNRGEFIDGKAVFYNDVDFSGWVLSSDPRLICD